MICNTMNGKKIVDIRDSECAAAADRRCEMADSGGARLCQEQSHQIGHGSRYGDLHTGKRGSGQLYVWRARSTSYARVQRGHSEERACGGRGSNSLSGAASTWTAPSLTWSSAQIVVLPLVWGYPRIERKNYLHIARSPLHSQCIAIFPASARRANSEASLAFPESSNETSRRRRRQLGGGELPKKVLCTLYYPPLSKCAV